MMLTLKQAWTRVALGFVAGFCIAMSIVGLIK